MTSALVAPIPEPVVARIDQTSTTVTSRVTDASALSDQITVTPRAAVSVVVVSRFDRGVTSVTFRTTSLGHTVNLSTVGLASSAQSARPRLAREKLSVRKKLGLLLKGASSITSMVPPHNRILSANDKAALAEAKVSAAMAKAERLIGE